MFRKDKKRPWTLIVHGRFYALYPLYTLFIHSTLYICFIKVLTNDTSTRVSTVRVENIRKTSSGLYNISGQRVNKSHKGIVIGKHKNSSIISIACPPLSLSDCKAPARQYLRRALRLSPCLSVAE